MNHSQPRQWASHVQNRRAIVARRCYVEQCKQSGGRRRCRSPGLSFVCQARSTRLGPPNSAILHAWRLVLVVPRASRLAVGIRIHGPDVSSCPLSDRGCHVQAAHPDSGLLRALSLPDMLHFDFRSCFVAAFSALVSFLPPRSISRWPAFPASDFSVMAVIPEVCFLFA